MNAKSQWEKTRSIKSGCLEILNLFKNPKSNTTFLKRDVFRKLNAKLQTKYFWQRRKWMAEENQPRCENCGNFIDDCKCVCPYCGETVKCTCCIGNDKATGG